MYDKKPPHVTLSVTDKCIVETSIDLDSGTLSATTLYPDGNVSTAITTLTKKDNFSKEISLRNLGYAKYPLGGKLVCDGNLLLKNHFCNNTPLFDAQPHVTHHAVDYNKAKIVARTLLGQAFMRGEVIPEAFQRLLVEISSEKGQDVAYGKILSPSLTSYGLTG